MSVRTVIHAAFVACSIALPVASYGAASATDALRDIRPAPQVCLRDDSVPVAAPAVPDGKSLRRPTVDATCALDASHAADLVQRPGTVVVDTRIPGEFERFHLNGAINLPVETIRIKPFLKARALLLVGNGKSEQELYAQCVQLRANGYASVHVLQGGITSWIASPLPVLGTAPSLPEMMVLSPADFFTEVSSGSTQVFLMPAVAKLKADIPSATLLDGKRLNDGLAAIRKKLKAPGASADTAALVIATDAAVSSADMAAAAALLHPRPVLFYLEGAKPYSRFVSVQKSVWAAQARGPKVPPCSLR